MHNALSHGCWRLRAQSWAEVAAEESERSAVWGGGAWGCFCCFAFEHNRMHLKASVVVYDHYSKGTQQPY